MQYRACHLCRRRKLRCNRGTPCSNCLRSRKQEACVYEDQEEQQPNTPAYTSSSSIHVPPAAQASTRSLSVLQDRIQQLEEQVSKLSPPAAHPPSSVNLVATIATPSAEIETQTSQLGGTYHIHHPAERPPLATKEQPSLPGRTTTTTGTTTGMSLSRSVSHKTRLFGQSHWFNTIVPLVRKGYLRT